MQECRQCRGIDQQVDEDRCGQHGILAVGGVFEGSLELMTPSIQMGGQDGAEPFAAGGGGAKQLAQTASRRMPGQTEQYAGRMF